MCLAVPGKIIQIKEGDELGPMALVDFSGVSRVVSLAFTPEAQEGDWVVVHAGYALNLLDEDEAQEALSIIIQSFQGNRGIG